MAERLEGGARQKPRERTALDGPRSPRDPRTSGAIGNASTAGNTPIRPEQQPLGELARTVLEGTAGYFKYKKGVQDREKRIQRDLEIEQAELNKTGRDAASEHYSLIVFDGSFDGSEFTGLNAEAAVPAIEERSKQAWEEYSKGVEYPEEVQEAFIDRMSRLFVTEGLQLTANREAKILADQFETTRINLFDAYAKQGDPEERAKLTNHFLSLAEEQGIPEAAASKMVEEIAQQGLDAYYASESIRIEEMMKDSYFTVDDIKDTITNPVVREQFEQQVAANDAAIIAEEQQSIGASTISKGEHLILTANRNRQYTQALSTMDGLITSAVQEGASDEALLKLREQRAKLVKAQVSHNQRKINALIAHATNAKLRGNKIGSALYALQAEQIIYTDEVQYNTQATRNALNKLREQSPEQARKDPQNYKDMPRPLNGSHPSDVATWVWGAFVGNGSNRIGQIHPDIAGKRLTEIAKQFDFQDISRLNTLEIYTALTGGTAQQRMQAINSIEDDETKMFWLVSSSLFSQYTQPDENGLVHLSLDPQTNQAYVSEHILRQMQDMYKNREKAFIPKDELKTAAAEQAAELEAAEGYSIFWFGTTVGSELKKAFNLPMASPANLGAWGGTELSVDDYYGDLYQSIATMYHNAGQTPEMAFKLADTAILGIIKQYGVPAGKDGRVHLIHNPQSTEQSKVSHTLEELQYEDSDGKLVGTTHADKEFIVAAGRNPVDGTPSDADLLLTDVVGFMYGSRHHNVTMSRIQSDNSKIRFDIVNATGNLRTFYFPLRLTENSPKWHKMLVNKYEYNRDMWRVSLMRFLNLNKEIETWKHS